MFNLFIVNFVSSELKNGVNTYVSNLTNGLLHYYKNKVNIFLVELSFDPAVFCRLEQLEGHTKLIIPLPFIGGRVLADKKTELKYFNRVIDLVFEKLSIEHLAGEHVFHLNWLNLYDLSKLLRKRIACKVVLTKHMISWKDAVNNRYPEFIIYQKAYLSGEKITPANDTLRREIEGYMNFDHIITVTECARNCLINSYGIDGTRTTVVKNGMAIPEQQPRPKTNKFRTKFGISEQDKVLLFIGRKGKYQLLQNLLVELAQCLEEGSLSNFKLVVIGQLNFEEVLRWADGIWGHVIFTGTLERDMLFELYKVVDVGILLSLHEQCSYAGIEMMLNGIPIISTRTDGLPEMIIHDHNGFLVELTFKDDNYSLDATSLRKHLVSLLSDGAGQKRMGDNARLFAEKHYTLKRMTEATFNIYTNE